MSDFNNHPDKFLFHKCCKVLERLSIRNAKYSNAYIGSERIIPQDALIKFVRNAPPTLKWFRSDLTKENMDLLRLEQPGIEYGSEGSDDDDSSASSGEHGDGDDYEGDITDGSSDYNSNSSADDDEISSDVDDSSSDDDEW